MLSIMERPRPAKYSLTKRAHLESTMSARSSTSAKRRENPGSRRGISTGMGFATLNYHSKRQSAFEISNQNLKMVKNLCNVKPTIPSPSELKRWTDRHSVIRKSIGIVRYGTPKVTQASVISRLTQLEVKNASQKSQRSSSQTSLVKLAKEHSRIVSRAG